MGIQAGANGVSRDVAALRCGVAGVSREVTEGYAGVGGAARQFWAPASKTYAWGRYQLITETTYTWAESRVDSNGNGGYGGAPSGTAANEAIENPDTGIVTMSDINELPNSFQSPLNVYATSYEVTGAETPINNKAISVTCSSSASTRYYRIYASKSSGMIPIIFWAVYERLRAAQTSYSKGAYIDQVTSQDPDAYPQNGAQDGYWYEYVGEVEPEPLPDSFQATLYVRYSGSTPGLTHTETLTLQKASWIGGSGYQGTFFAGNLGGGTLHDLWLTLPAEIYAETDPLESRAQFDNGNSYTPTHYDPDRTFYFIEGSNVSFTISTSITFQLTTRNA